MRKFDFRLHQVGVCFECPWDVDGAITAFKEAFGRTRSTPRLTLLGLGAPRQGRPRRTITAFNEAIKHDPKGRQAHSNLGTVLWDKGDLDGAIAAHKEAIRLDPSSLAHTGLGLVLSPRATSTEPSPSSRSPQHNPKDAPAHCDLARRLRPREIWTAPGELREAIKHNPKYAGATPVWGRLCRPRATRWGRRRIQGGHQADPKDAYAHTSLGLALHARAHRRPLSPRTGRPSSTTLRTLRPLHLGTLFISR